MKKAIDFYRKIQTKKRLLPVYKNQYAFVGVGNHSLTNLYPILSFLAIQLKYIVCKSQNSVDLLQLRHKHIISTTDYEKVLADPDICGVLISASPSAHYQLVCEALKAGKHVFVEKPPCRKDIELKHLIELSHTSGKTCLVGMQKRYSPCSQHLRRAICRNTVISYQYRFCLGLYPEGDEFLDLFIHPIDLVAHLFGNYEILSVNVSQVGSGKTYFIHTLHDNQTIGSIELSTHYTWKKAFETLQVNTSKGIYRMENHEILQFETKPLNVAGLPIEKVIDFKPQLTTLFDRNTFTPIVANNQLYSAGYFDELRTFFNFAEAQKGFNLSSPKDLQLTFSVIKTIKECIEKKTI